MKKLFGLHQFISFFNVFYTCEQFFWIRVNISGNYSDMKLLYSHFSNLYALFKTPFIFVYSLVGISMSQ
jgi:hypothetical protein